MKNVTKLIMVILFAVTSVTLFSMSTAAYAAPGASALPDNHALIDEVYECSTSDCQGTGVVRVATVEAALAPTSTLSGSFLTNFEKKICIELKDKIALVANGSLSSTVFSITSDLSELSWTKNELGCQIKSNGSFTTAAKNALKAKFKEAANTLSILYSLVTDYPYELFWFDKTVGISCNYEYRGNDSQMYITSLTYSFTVSEDYRYSSSTTYKVNSTKIAQANNVLANIQAIVDKYAHKSDLEKLEGYKEEICSLVSYNYDAIENDYAYGNPWQLIHVFDGDASTKVVCEGYAKAFKYLCDLSDFDKDISCYLVDGYTGERHMWNVVSINGINYLVDVTFCDSASVGTLYTFFLAGGTSSNSGMTHVVADSCTYTYYDVQYNLHGNGYLVLSETSYHEHRYGTDWKLDCEYHWQECSCGKKIDLSAHTPTDSSNCSVCDVDFDNTLIHNYNVQNTDSQYLKQQATCLWHALYYYSCACGAKGTNTFKYGELAPHAYQYQNLNSTYLKSEATCTSRPVYYYSCACGEKGSTTFEYGFKLAHNYTEQKVSSTYLKKAATCTNKAVYYYSCACGAKGTEIFEYGSKLAHSYNIQNTGAQYIKSAATCTTKAVYYYSCSCGAMGTTTFSFGPTAAHTYGTAWLSDGTYHWHECSCGEKSNVAIHTSSTPATTTQKAVCSVCNSEFGDLLTHNFNKKVTKAAYLKSPATCTEKAVYYYSCACGEKGAQTFEYGAKLAHRYTVKNTNAQYLKSPATCTNEAVYYYSCSCSAKGSATFKVGESLGHSFYSSDVCSTCGYVLEQELPEADDELFENDDLYDTDDSAGSLGFPDDEVLDEGSGSDNNVSDETENFVDENLSFENDYVPEKPKSFWDMFVECILAIFKFLFGSKD